MNKERLVIKNFGPIQSVDLELGKMTVLIGENATGKSTIAKVLSICRYFSYIVDVNKIINYNTFFVENGLNDWGIRDFLKNESYIEYENNDYKLIVDYINFEIEEKEIINLFKPILIPKTDRFKNLLKSFYESKDKNGKIAISADFPYEFLKNEVKPILYNPFFIPAERSLQSIFSLGKSSINNMNDALFNQFSQLFEISTTYISETDIKALDIVYKNINGKGFVKKNIEKEYYSLENSASGYQSIIPIVLAVKKFQDGEHVFIIEEPENNLFPKTQKKLVEFFVENINNHGHQFILPTHSPYILSSLNNCLYASKLSKIENGIFMEEINAILPKEYWLNLEDLSVYYLEIGEAKDILNKEESLIDIDDLDSVSRDINKVFDELLTIEMKHEG